MLDPKIRKVVEDAFAGWVPAEQRRYIGKMALVRENVERNYGVRGIGFIADLAKDTVRDTYAFAADQIVHTCESLGTKASAGLETDLISFLDELAKFEGLDQSLFEALRQYYSESTEMAGEAIVTQAKATSRAAAVSTLQLFAGSLSRDEVRDHKRAVEDRMKLVATAVGGALLAHVGDAYKWLAPYVGPLFAHFSR